MTPWGGKIRTASVLAAAIASVLPAHGRAAAPTASLPPSLRVLVLDDEGLRMPLKVSGATVGDALGAAGVPLRPGDLLAPDVATPLTAVTTVVLRRQRIIHLKDGAAPVERIPTHNRTVGDILDERGIVVGALDRLTPDRATLLPDAASIVITRVTETTKTEEESIPPPVIVRSDPGLALGKEIVDDPGAPGRASVTIRTRTENVSRRERRVLKRTVAEAPRPRRIRRGTKIVVRDSAVGLASWFRSAPQTAAHRVFPFGTRLRVVRADTGSSTIVRVADRGPFLPGRIVDLSADAFRALAPLGKGVIAVRIERLE